MKLLLLVWEDQAHVIIITITIIIIMVVVDPGEEVGG